MKHNFCCGGLLIFTLLLVICFETSARVLQTKQGQEMVDLNRSINNSKDFHVDVKDSDSLSELMGMEDCGNGDDECLKRRVIAEAHLDYIYTQHHKP